MKTLRQIQNIAIAGSGNVATHLARGFKQHGFRISGIWSRDFQHASALADSCNSVAYTELPGLCLEADLIVITVPDQFIGIVAREMAGYKGIVVHTAGSVPMEVLDGLFEKYGVIYPLQTFSKEIVVNFKEVPFFLEASSPFVGKSLKDVVQTLSEKVFGADSEQRLLLHTAAVFAGNYTNLMYVIGNELLKSTGLPPEVLHPLITETARKAVTGDPFILQTGPARRNDTVTLQKHVETLASLPEYAELYRLLADMISKKYNLKIR